jgi:hypothetical protein
VGIQLERTQGINRNLWNLEDVSTEHIGLFEIIVIFIIMPHVLHRLSIIQ